MMGLLEEILENIVRLSRDPYGIAPVLEGSSFFPAGSHLR